MAWYHALASTDQEGLFFLELFRYKHNEDAVRVKKIRATLQELSVTVKKVRPPFPKHHTTPQKLTTSRQLLQKDLHFLLC